MFGLFRDLNSSIYFEGPGLVVGRRDGQAADSAVSVGTQATDASRAAPPPPPAWVSSYRERFSSASPEDKLAIFRQAYLEMSTTKDRSRSIGMFSLVQEFHKALPVEQQTEVAQGRVVEGQTLDDTTPAFHALLTSSTPLSGDQYRELQTSKYTKFVADFDRSEGTYQDTFKELKGIDNFEDAPLAVIRRILTLRQMLDETERAAFDEHVQGKGLTENLQKLARAGVDIQAYLLEEEVRQEDIDRVKGAEVDLTELSTQAQRSQATPSGRKGAKLRVQKPEQGRGAGLRTDGRSGTVQGEGRDGERTEDPQQLDHGDSEKNKGSKVAKAAGKTGQYLGMAVGVALMLFAPPPLNILGGIMALGAAASVTGVGEKVGKGIGAILAPIVGFTAGAGTVALDIGLTITGLFEGLGRAILKLAGKDVNLMPKSWEAMINPVKVAAEAATALSNPDKLLAASAAPPPPAQGQDQAQSQGQGQGQAHGQAQQPAQRRPVPPAPPRRGTALARDGAATTRADGGPSAAASDGRSSREAGDSSGPEGAGSGGKAAQGRTSIPPELQGQADALAAGGLASAAQQDGASPAGFRVEKRTAQRPSPGRQV